jgi:PAS domain S-box-containing protein
MISASAALTGSYDYNEVARSVLIAFVASYAALDLTGRVTAARGRVRLAWLSGGAIAMGIGIWAMHFKGMLALRLPVPVEYHWPTVLASLLVAILASGVALYVASCRKMGLVAALTGSIFMATGIAGMHYIGMAAMRLPAISRYSPPLVTCSILLAILFSLIALLMAFDLREETRWSVPRRLGSATVMGVAVSAMHYTGMAAASFIAASPADLSHAVTISPLANNGIATVTLIVIVAAITTSSVDRRRNEGRLRLVIDTAPAMLHSARPDGYVDFFNKRWLEYVGVSLEDISGCRWTNVIHPEDVEGVVGKWRSSVETGKPFDAEARLRRADGEYRLMLLRKVPLRDEAGSIVKWYGSAIDIEERKRAEQELRQAEEHIRAILEYSPNWIFLKDTEGRYLLVNREIERVFGISQEQIKGKTDSEIFPPEQAAEYRANDLKVLRAGLTTEFEEIALLEDGPHTSIVHKFPLFDTHGNIYATGGVATDITERKRAEEARRYSEEQYRTVVETATDAVVSIDEDSKILFVNPATTTIFGYDTPELIGRPLMMLMPESLRKLHEAGFRRYLGTGERHLNWQGAELTALRKNGQEFPVEVSFGEMISNGHKVFTGFIRDISEKKRAEDESRKQKEVFQKIFENIPVLIAFRWKDRELQLVNPEWERTTGWKLEEIREQNLDIFAEFFPDPHYRQVIRDLIAASTGQWNDIQLTARDGRVIDLASTFVHLSDGSTLFIGRDVTERKRAEQSLLLFRMLIDQSNDAIEVIDPETLRFIDINGRACLDLGYSREELLSLSVYDVDPFIDELMLPRVAGKLENSGSAVFESFHRRKDGSTFPVEVSIKQVRLDRVYRVSVVRDITERKRAEAELRESEARFRLVADSAPVMIWMSGTDRLCTYFNKPWLDFTGRSIDRELGNGWAERVDPEDLQRCLDTYIRAFDRREAFRMEYRLRRHDGEFRWVLDIGAPRFNPDGSFAGYIGSCIDVTEQRRSDEQLRQVQENLARVTRVVAMGELAAAIAHEVNQPLTAIVTNANFCLRRLDGATSKPDELRAAITAIASDGTRASGVISRIRSLLKKGAPDRAELDINEIIQDVSTLLRHEFTRSRVSLRTELASDLPRVPGDPVQLQQVLINLIMNAIEATSSSTNGRRTILIRSAKNPDGVLVQVQDSGPGIAPELADRIFEPFFTTKAEGIGMGLSISHSIVESHGGHLGIVPSPTGALFEFTLPTD